MGTRHECMYEHVYVYTHTHIHVQALLQKPKPNAQDLQTLSLELLSPLGMMSPTSPTFGKFAEMIAPKIQQSIKQ